MKANFKQLGIVSAIAAATAAYASIATAQITVPEIPVPQVARSIGDVGLVPYYSVRGNFGTGVHIINTSSLTQVVKLRMRRGADSMDALDFNLIMSPKDEWTGFLSRQDNGTIAWKTQDTTCTAPQSADGTFTVPGIYDVGAGEGYIEVFGMGSADTLQPISVAAEHVVGVDGTVMPRDCDAVASNFRDLNAPNNITGSGVINTAASRQNNPTGLVDNAYGDTGNVLKVSYFVRDSSRGVEFGNDGVHLENFLANPSISHQEAGLNSGEIQGFDFPDLNGGLPEVIEDRNRYNAVRSALGGVSVINDWSANADLNVGTDWVVTIPGQYNMLNLFAYFDALDNLQAAEEAGDGFTEEDLEKAFGTGPGQCAPDVCDFRDLPVTARFEVYDREEQEIAQEDGGLVVSPSIPGERVTTLLSREVNVIEWGVGSVLESNSPITVDTPDSPFGWAELSVAPSTAKTQRICEISADFDEAGEPTPDDYICELVDDASSIPMIGFVAWERSFADNPSANYGRIVEHSYGIASSAD